MAVVLALGYLVAVFSVNEISARFEPVNVGFMDLRLEVFIVGLVLILRCATQHYISFAIWPLMMLSLTLVYFAAPLELANASTFAFAVALTASWVVFTFASMPFIDRVLVATAYAAPFDAIVFLLVMGWFAWDVVLIETIAKLLPAALLWAMVVLFRRDATLAFRSNGISRRQARHSR